MYVYIYIVYVCMYVCMYIKSIDAVENDTIAGRELKLRALKASIQLALRNTRPRRHLLCHYLHGPLYKHLYIYIYIYEYM